MGTTRTGRFVFADQQADKGKVIGLFQRHHGIGRMRFNRVYQWRLNGLIRIVPFLQAGDQYIVVAAVHTDRDSFTPFPDELGIFNHHSNCLLRVILPERIQIDRNIAGVLVGLVLNEGTNIVKLLTWLCVCIRPQSMEVFHDFSGIRD